MSFFDYYGKNEIDFSVRRTTSSVGGLNFQMIACHVKDDQVVEDISHSIAIDEVAFSVIERVLLERKPYAHWGETLITFDAFDLKVIELKYFIQDIKYECVIDVCAKELKANKEKYEKPIVYMVNEIVEFILSCKELGYDLIKISGI